MLRPRAGKASAHIAAPRSNGSGALTNPHGFDGSSEKPSRLNEKTLGLTNRIWIILVLVLAIIALTRFIIPADSSLPRHGLTDAGHLKPKNYLNATDTDPNPFDFCPLFGPGDEVGTKHGVLALTKSRVHLGSGQRVQRVIHKALSGLPVTISVIGGSVSACHGAGDDPISPKCYPARFFEWWNKVFPHPASELTNGAQRRTNSAYFGFCNAHHLPDQTDLVIVELDVDDPNNEEWKAHFELLIRSLLIRPDQPAVVVLGHFSPQIIEAHGYHGPEVMHSVVSQFYDVPHISVKPMLYPSFIAKPDSIKAYYADPVLANPNGHRLLADVLIHYFQSQTCAAWASATGHAHDVASPLLVAGEIPGAPERDRPLMDKHGIFGGLGNRPQEGDAANGDGDNSDANSDNSRGRGDPHLRVPVGRIASRPGQRIPPEVAPACVSANDLINPLPPSLFTGSGWTARHPSAGAVTTSAYAHYWAATQPTSRLRIPIQVGSGDIAIYYLKDRRTDENGGSAVQCWVDNNYAGAKMLTNRGDDVGEITAVVELIDHFVTRGSHYVECQLMGEEGYAVPEFRLLGVFSS